MEEDSDCESPNENTNTNKSFLSDISWGKLEDFAAKSESTVISSQMETAES